MYALVEHKKIINNLLQFCSLLKGKYVVMVIISVSDVNQEKIVEEGGLDALLMLLRSSQNTTILRVASGAIANLAMSGTLCLPPSLCLYGIKDMLQSLHLG